MAGCCLSVSGFIFREFFLQPGECQLLQKDLKYRIPFRAESRNISVTGKLFLRYG